MKHGVDSACTSEIPRWMRLSDNHISLAISLMRLYTSTEQPVSSCHIRVPALLRAPGARLWKTYARGPGHITDSPH